MRSRFARRATVLYCALAAGWACRCSIYDDELIGDARGGPATGAPDDETSSGSSDSGVVVHEVNGGSPGSGEYSVSDGGAGSGGATGGVSSGGNGNESSLGGSESCFPGGTPDCIDLCPNEPTKTEPGECGCGVSAAEDDACGALKQGIVHRYSFDGSSSEVTDVVGNKNGVLSEGSLSDGLLALDGSGKYVSLPQGTLSSLHDASFEFWFTLEGTDDYQRLFDCGDSVDGVGHSYLFVAANTTNLKPGTGFSLSGNGEEAGTRAVTPITVGRQYHLVLVADETNGLFGLYVDTAFQSGIAFTKSLTDVNDIHCYLGRSLFEADAFLNGSIDEFRIYDVALSKAAIEYSFAQGPEATFFD